MSTPNASERFLVFTAGDVRYALPEARVREALRLPRLTALDETPPWVLGAFDLHGELTPLISIERCLEGTRPAASANDLAIALEVAGHPLAIHAQGLLSVDRAEPRSPIWPAADETGSALLEKELQIGGGTAWLLSPERIRVGTRQNIDVADLPDGRLLAFERGLDAAALGCLDDRARWYSRLDMPGIAGEREAFWLLRLGGRSFALRRRDCLGVVRIGSAVPVPCTPAHVLGVTAVHGTRVTLLDVRTALGAAAEDAWQPGLAAIVGFDGQRVGIGVDAVEQLVCARPEPASALPAATPGAAQHWTLGALRDCQRTLPIIQTDALLSDLGLLRDERTAGGEM
jgi:purine-binding chemotaxis protein CheW